MKIFIGMECSGAIRRRFAALGHGVASCDLKPAEDGADSSGRNSHLGAHWQGDVFTVLDRLMVRGWVPDLAIFHNDCTYLTNAAAWAFGDGPYHQRVKPGTLVGADRRQARDEALAGVLRVDALPIAKKVLENPVGALSTLFRKPDQIVQPYMFGDDASKATCLWLWGIDPMPVPDKALWFPPRMVGARPRWSNQTDSGQNRLSPGEQRSTDRARTYPGIAAALVDHLTERTRLL